MNPRALRFALLGLGLLLPGIVRAADAPAPSPSPSPAVAESSARATLRRAIEPVVGVFAHAGEGPNHAWVLRVRLVDSNLHPPELRGSLLGTRVVTSPADKIITQYAALGTVVTICRQGQTAWAMPASKLAPILAKVEANPPTAADRKPIAPLRMPVPEPVFWLGFYFLSLKDVGTQTVGGTACRVMDFDPPDEHGKGKQGKELRLYIRAADNQFMRFDSHDANGHSTYVVEENRVLPTLPDAEFQPPAGQRGEVLEIPIERFRPFMKELNEEEEKRRKEVRDHRAP